MTDAECRVWSDQVGVWIAQLGAGERAAPPDWSVRIAPSGAPPAWMPAAPHVTIATAPLPDAVHSDAIVLRSGARFVLAAEAPGALERLLRDAWRTMPAVYMEPAPRPPLELNLWIDRNVAWASVAAVADAARAVGVTRLNLVVEAAEVVPQPTMPPRVALWLEGSVAAMRERGLPPDMEGPSLLEMVFERCEGIDQAYEPLAFMGPKERWAHLARAVPSALRRCRCQANLSELLAFYWIQAREHGDDALVGFISITLAEPTDTRATVVRHPGATPWREIAPTLRAAAGPVLLTVEAVAPGEVATAPMDAP